MPYGHLASGLPNNNNNNNDNNNMFPVFYMVPHAAEDVRARLLAQTRDPALVARLAPMQPGEAEAARRARLLYERISTSLGLRPATLPQVRLPLATSA